MARSEQFNIDIKNFVLLESKAKRISNISNASREPKDSVRYVSVLTPPSEDVWLPALLQHDLY